MILRNEILLILAAVCCVLALASAAGRVLAVRFAGSAAIENLNQRTRSWWVIVGLAGFLALAGPAALTAGFALLSFLALREFLTAATSEPADRRVILACYLVGLPLQFALAAWGPAAQFSLMLPVGALIALPLAAALAGETRNFLTRAAGQYFGLMLCVYGISHVPALLSLSLPGRRRMLLVMFLLLIAQAGDVLQYLWGKWLGRHPLAPSVSPGKTVEGFLGGVACSTALGAALWWITPFTVFQATIAALVIALSGTAGGLVLSAIKRDRRMKHWSNLVPGHGGVLDRLDSLCLSAPLFFHLARALGA